MDKSASLRSWRFATRLDLRGTNLPVSPSQRCRERRLVQGVRWRFGHRICLLKGCEQFFRPPHRLSRYCSSDCQAKAFRWRMRTANRRYRASEQGKCRRRAQACRYRERCRQRANNPTAGSHSPGRTDRTTPARPCGEGYPHPLGAADFFCQRPGCYQTFAKTARSPLQKFCSAACRQALRRVLLRERRWNRLLGMAVESNGHDDDFW
jgi:hypothetical protein